MMIMQALAALSPDLATVLLRSAVAPHLTARVTYHGRICVPEGLAEIAPNLHPSVSLLHACAPCIDADSNLYLAINGNAQMQLLRSALPTLGHLTRLRLYLPRGRVLEPKGTPDCIRACCALPSLHSMQLTISRSAAVSSALAEGIPSALHLESFVFRIQPPESLERDAESGDDIEANVVKALARREAAAALPLRRLALDRCTPPTAVLCRVLRQLRGLQELQMQSVDLAGTYTELAAVVAKLPDFRHLALRTVECEACELDEQEAIAFMAAMGALSRLQALQISDLPIPRAHRVAEAMRLHLAHSTHLTLLDLSSICVDVNLDALGELFRGLPRLQRLVLCNLNDWHGADDLCGEPFARGIAGLTALTHLNLAQTPLPVLDRGRGRYLGEQHTALQELSISLAGGVAHGEPGVRAFAELMSGIATLPALHTLSTTPAWLPDEDLCEEHNSRAAADLWPPLMEAWGRTIAALTTLTRLDLRRKRIPAAAVAELAKTFCECMAQSSKRGRDDDGPLRPPLPPPPQAPAGADGGEAALPHGTPPAAPTIAAEQTDGSPSRDSAASADAGNSASSSDDTSNADSDAAPVGAAVVSNTGSGNADSDSGPAAGQHDIDPIANPLAFIQRMLAEDLSEDDSSSDGSFEGGDADGLPAASAALAARAAGGRVSRLRELDLGDAGLGDRGVQALAPVLAFMPHLTALHLNGCRIRHGAVKSLGEAFVAAARALAPAEGVPREGAAAHAGHAVQAVSGSKGGAAAAEAAALPELQVLSMHGSMKEWNDLEGLLPALPVLPVLRELGVWRHPGRAIESGMMGGGMLSALQATKPLLCIRAEPNWNF